MNPLLCIHSYPAARDIVFRHWPHYKRSGMDILGVVPVGEKHEWPEDIPLIIASENAYIKGGNLPIKLVETFKQAVTYKDYDSFCVIEYDSLFFKLPPTHPGGLFTKVAGMCPPEWRCGDIPFYHTPWWADRDTAQKIAAHGSQMLGAGDILNGSPDIFLGALCQRNGINVSDTGTGTFSCNNRDLRVPSIQKQARQAIESGIWFMHGVADSGDFNAMVSVPVP